MNTDWQARVDAVYTDGDEATYSARVDAIAAELPEDHPVALFERGGARDASGDEKGAVGFYERALDAGLDSARHRQCVIQLASSHRNLGAPERAAALLTAERDRTSDELDDAVVAFLSLVLADLGREREALAMTLTALTGHLPRYRRSLLHYAGEL